MNKKKIKIIQEIIGEAIKPYGFECLTTEHNFLVYQKTDGDLKQSISIDIIMYNGLRLCVATNAFGGYYVSF
jgi:hypothetical protein